MGGSGIKMQQVIVFRLKL